MKKNSVVSDMCGREGGDNLGLKSRPYISYMTVGESLISLGHNQLICKT